MHIFWICLWGISIFVFVAFTFVVAFGAPFLPTLKKQIPKALELIDLQPGQILLELGSGDGRVLAAAAAQGLFAVGYELNPLLAAFSWIKTRRYGNKVKIIWGNYWTQTLPEADGIFVFLLQPYMEKLDNKIIQEFNQPVKLVSFAFHIPDKIPTKTLGGMYLYHYLPKKITNHRD